MHFLSKSMAISELLPALRKCYCRVIMEIFICSRPSPPTWKEGSIKGLKARGGFTIDMEWKEGKMTVANITSPYEQTIEIVYNNQIKKTHFNAGERKKISF
ncbi:glycoside hydrolase family 95-like protein [Bacteroides thetaiotaomicron]|uniref:glycoside hydrolase family 95-like protein n=2 Tax=Bacteroides thetaiotaomicron TaxID=818 RepID=UPI0035ABE43A